jgi:hypothetical protein
VLDLDDLESARLKIHEHKDELIAEADAIDPLLKKFGGSCRLRRFFVIEFLPGSLGQLLDSRKLRTL